MWTQDTELLAAVYDQLRLLSFYTLRLAGNRADEPEPFPRPGVEPDDDAWGIGEFTDFLRGGGFE